MKKPIYNERIELNCSPKRALCFIRKAPLFGQFGQSGRTGGG